MATLEHIHFVPHFLEHTPEAVTYLPSTNRPSIKDLPQIFWADCIPWKEANLWAMERATTGDASLKTVASNMNGLLHYATFLESRNLQWFEFPTRKADRCLVLYRGTLIKMRDNGQISPSTASEYMRNCVMFYRWIRHKELLSSRLPLWKEKTYFIKYFDQIGFERTVSGTTTDLSIPNRKRLGQTLEDGLLPVSQTDRDAILNLAAQYASPELYLMLVIGFFSGMRLGSICSLTIQTLENATPDPSAKGLLRLAIGPGASPPVHTKFGVTGQVWIPETVRDELLEYARSTRRMEREAKAAPENRDLLFLTRFGNTYGRRGSDQSSAVNVEMSKFRKRGLKEGLQVLRKFRFHQSRCTFGTELARLALSNCSDVSIVIAIVSDALLHSPNSEATTFKYIKFIQAEPIKRALANSFMTAFSGIDFETQRHE
ncbi:phage integrase family protein [Herbaspirillum sp. CF444]|uniref:site-specific integrase n=1 Tax=Herbaspirillum sp. CF444 TaxID=1144319 RepID=UPI00027240B6|nr:site-specific integrase [Herbaspirillum sp. CF444]EJL81200.1 phage integrase family protein [Herbaspirillum sp. CF444]